MARKLRLEYEGAVYHVISRGNYRADVFAKEGTKAAFVKCLGEAAEKAGWVVHAWCVMSNHYHLCVETPRPNLVEGMRWLQSTFCVRFNRLRNERGHVFQGRYKALLVEPAVVGSVCHYIHLNPVRAGLASVKTLGQWKWTSIPALLEAKQRAEWFSPQEALLHAGGLQDNRAGRTQYLDYLEWLQEDEAGKKELQFEQMSKNWAIGTRDFKLELLKQHKELVSVMSRAEQEPRELSESLWEEHIRVYLRALKKTEHHISSNPKAAQWKVAMATKMKRSTTAPNPWLANRLNMGSPFRLSRLTSAARKNPADLKQYDRRMTKCKV